jgi:hypothetical protein
MPPKTVHPLKKVQNEILNVLKSHESIIFSPTDLRQIFDNYREEWDLPKSVTLPRFLAFLVNELNLKWERCLFHRTYTRYTMGEVPLYALLLSLVPDSYFSHFTALDLYGLTESAPDRVYLNYPQKRKGSRDTSLDQNRIDQAFRRAVRVSKNSALFRGNQVLLLNSMGNDHLGIIEMDGPEETRIRVTDVERTLIDIVVRPIYCGGIANVLAAYRKAAGRVSIRKLAEHLQALDFTYPYHQSIGFCLERANYKDSEIAILLDLPTKHDFYLDYQMKEPDYSKNWRLYFPRGLE